MKQILVLERKELDLLKSGETLTLNLPSGEAIQLGLDIGKRIKNKPEVSQTETKVTGSILKTREFFKKNPTTWYKSKDVKDYLGCTWPQASGSVFCLKRIGQLDFKQTGKTPNGRPVFSYKISKKGLGYAEN